MKQQAVGGGHQTAASWGNRTTPGGLEPATFTSQRHDLIRLTGVLALLNQGINM